MAAKRVLLVDDDQSIIEVQKMYFEKEGYQVSTCMQGDKAVAAFETFNPDIIILDLMLPGMDGNDICREIRKSSDVPIIMLTARTDTLDKIIGLELGADDYVPKPFEPKELLARVKAVLRRTDRKSVPQEQTEEENKSKEIVSYPGFVVDKARYVVTVDGEEIYMPPKELELLFFLASNPDRVFTREQLLDHIWGYEYIGDTRTVDVHIKRLREKINDHEAWRLHTVWGVGYKFEARSV